MKKEEKDVGVISRIIAIIGFFTLYGAEQALYDKNETIYYGIFLAVLGIVLIAAGFRDKIFKGGDVLTE